MGFVSWFFSRGSNEDFKWRSLVITLPWVIGLLFVGSQAIRENSAAKRQQTSQGVVKSYQPSSHNLCDYTFSLGGKQYIGSAMAPTHDIKVGDHVLVYFDSQDPEMNGLEDFSILSNSDRGFAYILMVGIALVVGVIAIGKSL